jgi:ferredoxin
MLPISNGGGRGRGRAMGQGRGCGGGRGRGRGLGGGGARGRGRGLGPGGGQGLGPGRSGRCMAANQGAGTALSASRLPQPEGPPQAQALRPEAEALLAQPRAISARLAETQGATPAAAVPTARAHGRASSPGRPVVTIATVDKERCIGCGSCDNVCPEGAISVDDVAMIDPHSCTGCGSCMQYCPTEAISLVEWKRIALCSGS